VRAGLKIPPRTLVAGVPAKVMRELSEQELAWKLDGTRTYQRLTERCLATMKECEPLREEEPGRPRLDAGRVQPLIATRREGA
jgi:phenylacetic acid degradation protein